jgi:Tol biopolymer transport system component
VNKRLLTIFARFSALGATAAVCIGLPAAALGNDASTLPLQPTRTLEFTTDEGTWMSVDIDPKGQVIVFDLLGDLYTLPAEGGAAEPLTTGMAFDSQPVFSPDGSWIAFVSDRSGGENLWLVRPDGSETRQVTFRDDNRILSSPEWSADGAALYASIHRSDRNAYSLWRFDVAGVGEAEEVIPVRGEPGQSRDEWQHTIDAVPSSDGRYLYYAGHRGGFGESMPEWTIRRRDLESGEEEILVSAPRSPRPDLSLGSFFRPAIAPDGRLLVYATRFDGQTGLRILDLETATDRWLAWPVTRDQVEASHWQGSLPRYTFTPDGRALLLSIDGGLSRLDIGSGKRTEIPFEADISLGLGPNLREPIAQETGPVRARLMQAPEVSPDGRTLAFSALTRNYLMPLEDGARPRRLTDAATPEFHPSWSPDGNMLVYVTWTARDAGHIWIAPADGSVPPRRLTETAAFYTAPVFAPDGQAVVALRSSNVVRMRTFMDYGLYRDADLIRLPLNGDEPRTLTSGSLGGKPGFSADGKRVFINGPDGVNALPIGGGERSLVVQVVGPGWYFAEGPAAADNLKVSPDGRWALSQFAQQLHLVEVPQNGETEVSLFDPAVRFRKLTDIGADFFDWADGGATITWAVGSTWYRRPLTSVALNEPHSADRSADAPIDDARTVSRYPAVVEVPRDTPRGSLLLRGATAITMNPEADGYEQNGGAIDNADVLIVDDRIAAIGPRGSLDVPAEATVRDVGGRFIAPGFTDTHDHVAEIRRDVLDLETWAPAASLAYGVTTKFDPSSLSIDMLAYEDLIDAGMITGARIHTTATALFSFNEFTSQHEVAQVLKRYRDHYRTRNVKMYRTGNRRVRQWVAMASAEAGMLPTAEGALALKLDLTQIVDGFIGQEHALPAAPLYRDVIRLMTEADVSYTATLIITNGGPEGQDWFIALNDPGEDPLLNRFWPRYAIDIKMRQRTWRTLDDYFFPQVAAGVGAFEKAGGLVGIGSHGEAPGIGFHWEMQAHAMGGMSALDILQAATLGGARTIGRDAEFGSLEAGKYADLVILDRDPRQDIANTLSLEYVMKNGRLYEAATLNEVWPRQREWPSPWFHSDRPDAAIHANKHPTLDD